MPVTAYFQTFNVAHKKSKNTGSTKGDLCYTFISRNSMNTFKCGIFHHSACVFEVRIC